MTANQLLNNATIHTIVPCEPEIDFESVLTQHPSPLQESQTLPLSNIQQRGLLFFGKPLGTPLKPLLNH